ncbi:MAG: ATPase domain-containing protein [Pseudomonadota bacterium]
MPLGGRKFASELRQVLAFVEFLNYEFAMDRVDGQGLAPKLITRQAAATFAKADIWEVAKTSPIMRHIQRGGFTPSHSIASSIENMLLRPPAGKTSSNLRLPDLFSDNYAGFIVFDSDSIDPHWTIKPVNDPSAARQFKGVAATYIGESVDPIAVLKNYLIETYGKTDSLAEIHIQDWIRREFGIRFNTEQKYALNLVCNRVNEIFYGEAHPSIRDVRANRPNTVSLSFLLSRVSSLYETVSDTPDRVALGVYLFYRLVNGVRLQYRVGDDEYLKPSRVCAVSPLRVLDNSYLQARVFGHYSNIPGLDFIFCGGLLPNTDTGPGWVIDGTAGSGKTTFALTLLANFAKAGKAAIYFSLEESYSMLVDRLVSLNLLDPSAYDLVEFSDESATGVFAEIEDSRGVLAFFCEPASDARPKGIKRRDLVGALERLSGGLRHRNWKAVAIDSVNALKGADPENSREWLGGFFDVLRRNGFWGLAVHEDDDDPEFSKISYLADTVIRLGIDNGNQRWMEIEKCRAQRFQPGKHPFRINSEKGVSVYPSADATISALRRRRRSIPSTQKFISLPKPINSLVNTLGIREKSSTLIKGSNGTAKPWLAMELATEPSIDTITESRMLPTKVLVVTFRIPESQYIRNLGASLAKRWDQLPTKSIRWFSVGRNFRAEHFLAELRGTFIASRRAGTPIDRVIFDHIEVADFILPELGNDPLFWPALFELVTTEPITSFFIFGESKASTDSLDFLLSGADYCIELERRKESGYQATLSKDSGRWIDLRNRRARFVLRDGLLAEVVSTATVGEVRRRLPGIKQR